MIGQVVQGKAGLLLLLLTLPLIIPAIQPIPKQLIIPAIQPSPNMRPMDDRGDGLFAHAVD